MNEIPAMLRQQRSTLVSVVVTFGITLLCLQLWVLREVLEGTLQSDGVSVVPAAVISAMCALGNWKLWSLLRGKV